MSIKASKPSQQPAQTFDSWGFVYSTVRVNKVTGVTQLVVQPNKASAEAWSMLPADAVDPITVPDAAALAAEQPDFAKLLRAATDANLAVLEWLLDWKKIK